MGLMDKILSGDFKSLHDLPEPPPEVKKMLDKMFGAALLKNGKCPNCGKVHLLPPGTEPVTQAQAYNESNGLADSYEYVPRKLEAIQFLPHNVPDVTEFLVRRGISFAYLVKSDGEPRLVLIGDTGELNLSQDELTYGRWVVVAGSREGGDLAASALDDSTFRQEFQATEKPQDIAVPEDAPDLDGEDDDFFGDGE